MAEGQSSTKPNNVVEIFGTALFFGLLVAYAVWQNLPFVDLVLTSALFVIWVGFSIEKVRKLIPNYIRIAHILLAVGAVIAYAADFASSLTEFIVALGVAAGIDLIWRSMKNRGHE